MPSLVNATAASAAPSPQPTSVSTTSSGTGNGGTATRSQWTRTFANGDSYSGEALHVNDKSQKPIKDGKGRYTWASSGAVYEGEWKGGRPHGSGVMTVPGADGYEYTGDFVDGQRSGRGRCRFANGRTYDGEWKADEMNGEGTVHGAPGADDYESYTGTFQTGKRSGPHGRCVYLNGDVYDGAWLAGKRQGMGEWRLHRPASSVAVAPVCYVGPFDHDVPHTTGSAEATVTYADGSSYVGAVNAQLRRHGRGVHRLACGDVFDGVFAQDQREGRGTLQRADGLVCEGAWRRGQLDGEVRVTFGSAPLGDGDGDARSAAAAQDVTSDVRNLEQLQRGPYPLTSYEGPCTAGVLTGGPATLLYADGSTYRGAVRHGLPHGTGVLRDRPLRFVSAGNGVENTADGSGGLRGRIAQSCIPAAASMTLISYDGSFAAGEPDGTGTAEWHVSSTPAAASPSSFSFATEAGAVVRATPLNFSGLLADGGLRWWRTSSYAAVDGTYAGQWLRGLPHGQGTWQWADGSGYTGEVAFYLPSGHGVYTSSSVQYTGDFKVGVPEGKGTYEDKEQGISYDGEWSAGKPHGEGVCTVLTESNANSVSGSTRAAAASAASPPSCGPVASPCTTVYEGSWEQGKPSGHGRTYASPDRQRVVYDGAYVDGRCEGEGTLYFGSVRRGSLNSEAATAAVHTYAQYRGTFRSGHPGRGPGCLTLKNNTMIDGEFDADLQPCVGATIVVRPPHEAWNFTGTFDATARVGHGTMTFPNGDVYKGDVEDATGTEDESGPETPSSSSPPLLYNLQRHGQGVYTFVEGNQLQCTWRHNVLHGAGVYTAADGTKTERTYADGVLMNDAAMSSIGAAGGGDGLASISSVAGNVFTPENEFPNTLSEEALKSRLPEVQQQQQQQQQQRKRAPFNFVRRGEARQASAVGAATPSSSTTSSPLPRHTAGNGTGSNVSKRSPPAQSLSPTASAAQKGGGGTSPRRRSSSPMATGAGRAAAPTKKRTGEASTPGGHKYSLHRRPTDGSTGPHAGGGSAKSPTAPNSVYLSRFQAGIRQLDNEPPRSPSPSAGKSINSSSNTDGTPGNGTPPVRTPAGEGGPLRRRLSSALAAGREQQQQQRLPPVTLQGSLMAMMAEACAIRNSREDEIHLLTEEMRQLNERIWQLRFVMANNADDAQAKKGSAKAPTPTRGLPSPGWRTSKNAVNAKPAETESAASRTQRLAALIQERRVIMEKLQYVVNDPE